MLGINPRGREVSPIQRISSAARLEVAYLPLRPDDQSIPSAWCMLKHRHGSHQLRAPTAAPGTHPAKLRLSMPLRLHAEISPHQVQ